MGMGRHLLRRAALACILGSLAAGPLWSGAGPLPARRGVAGPPVSASLRPIPSRQGHGASKAWSIDISNLASRQELDSWITQWSSSEGRRRLEQTWSRSFPFRSVVDGIIRRSGQPWELAAVPVVESNWRLDAVSSSGAAGPWQFLAATARGRGLVMDAWRDDRRDVWRATEAAMDELAFGYRLFDDWLLSIAAYNAGPTRLRSLRSAGDHGDYWSMLEQGVLPEETRDYVPQILAVAWITAHAGRLGFPIRWETPPQWRRIPIQRSIPLDELIAASGADEGRMRAAHRELQHPFTPPPPTPYALKVPENRSEAVLRWLEEREGSETPERFWRYTVRSGDTLSEIAAANGVSLTELMGYNGHVRRDALRIGERLYIPGSGTAPPGAEGDALPVWNGRYAVRSGDSLWSIARAHGVTPELLAETNHRPLDAVLLAGSVLRVPLPGEEM